MSRKQIRAWVDDDLKNTLKALSDSRRVPMTEIIETALHEYLNPDDYKTVSLEYLARLEKRHALVLKRLEMTLETLGKFVLVWFMNTPDPDNDALKRAMAHSGMARYEKFLDKVSASMNHNSVRQAFETRILGEDDFDDGGMR